MLTRWLTFTAFLAGSANPETAAMGSATPAVAPTRRVKGHPGEELTLNCGDGTNAGEVQYWHTPFGDLQSWGVHGELDPVFMHPDGSLVVPNSSGLHSGLYYCLLQHTEGTTLWPYQLHVGPRNQEHPRCRQGDAFRFRRDVGSVEERQTEGVSDGQFAGAVAASVLLTFVLGFSAGALSRTHVLRCLGAVTRRLQSPRKQCQTDTQDHGTEVTMTTLPPMSGDQAFEMPQNDGNEADCATTETTIWSPASSPPIKPQRSFRQKQQEEPGETTAYLEGCDRVKDEKEEEEEEEEVEVAGRSPTERNKGRDVEAEDERECRGFYTLGEDGGNQTGKDDKECSGDAEKKDGRESTKEKRSEEEEEGGNMEKGRDERRGEEEGNPEKGRDERNGEERGNMEEGRDERRGEEGGNTEKGRDERKGEEGGNTEKGRDERRGEEGGNTEKGRDERKGEEGGNTEKGRDERREEEVDDGERRRSEEDEETDSSSEDNETASEDTVKNGARAEGGGPSPPPGCRRRVIRLYQYDDDGRRYGHLPDPAPDEPGPAPRLKQRSLSLTRLSAIMAAASAGPLDTRERREEREEREEKPHFHMEI